MPCLSKVNETLRHCSGDVTLNQGTVCGGGQVLTVRKLSHLFQPARVPSGDDQGLFLYQEYVMWSLFRRFLLGSSYTIHHTQKKRAAPASEELESLEKTEYNRWQHRRGRTRRQQEFWLATEVVTTTEQQQSGRSASSNFATENKRERAFGANKSSKLSFLDGLAARMWYSLLWLGFDPWPKKSFSSSPPSCWLWCPLAMLSVQPCCLCIYQVLGHLKILSHQGLRLLFQGHCAGNCCHASGSTWDISSTMG